MNNAVLSIYTATYNRKDILEDKVKRILSIGSDAIDYFVLDDCSDDGTSDMLAGFNDPRLHILRNETNQGSKQDGVMQNWFQLLEACDGQFAFHLNDRDIIDTHGIQELCAFLKENPTLTGGMCDLTGGGYSVYQSPEESFMNLPYFGSHPTGIVFNMDEYRLLDKRKQMFMNQQVSIHPHDLVLGRLAEYGEMFRFHKIWNLADQESFANNRSFLYKKASVKDAWFSPRSRMREFELFVKNIAGSPFSEEVKKKKAQQIAKRYLFYCTLNYAFFISDEGQTSHYGIEPRKLSRNELSGIAQGFIQKSYGIMKDNNLVHNYHSYSTYMTSYFWTIYCAKPVWDKVKKLRRT